MFFSIEAPENLKSSLEISDTEVDSVKDTKVNIEPEPISVVGVVDSAADPENLKSSVDVSAVVTDSVVELNPNSDPDPG